MDRTFPELLQTVPDLAGLEPADTQEELPSILKAVGERVEAFFRDFQNTSSLEQIKHEVLDRNGRPAHVQTEVRQYLLIRRPDATTLGLEEFRANPSEGQQISLAGMITTEGFASQAEVFLPTFQQESRFNYLGRQVVQGHKTQVVAFAQQPALARLYGDFAVRNGPHAKTLQQGFAWIDSNTHQIIRLRADLLYPVPRVKLTRQTTVVRYAEVHFKKASLRLWLPCEVIVTVEYKGRLLRNLHFYSDFRMFKVESSWKVKPPKVEEP